MAKVDGPLLSLDASGSIGGAMTFSKWKGVNYVRYKTKPTNPQTTAQTTQRTAFSTAVAAWHALTTEVQDTWTARAKALGLTMSGFNLYVKEHIAAGGEPTMP
jgi:hypothetical protein